MATMVAEMPRRSLDQRRRALEKANEIRSHRAALKKQYKTGDADPLDALVDPLCGSWKVSGWLEAIPGKGRTKVSRFLWLEAISPSRTLAGLTPRQRSAVIDWLLG